MAEVKRFELHRDLDISGISGPGVVADGLMFPDAFTVTWPGGSSTELPPGWCQVMWRGRHASTVLWPSIDGLLAVNGHGGATRLVWLDPPGWWSTSVAPGVSVVHPIDDVIEHDVDGEDRCVCGPLVTPVPRDDGSMGWMYTHHSADGREQFE